jgi:hypothetical protein
MTTSTSFHRYASIAVGMALSFAAMGCESDAGREPDAAREEPLALGGPDTKKVVGVSAARDATPVAAAVPASSRPTASAASASPANPATRTRGR